MLNNEASSKQLWQQFGQKTHINKITSLLFSQTSIINSFISCHFVHCDFGSFCYLFSNFTEALSATQLLSSWRLHSGGNPV